MFMTQENSEHSGGPAIVLIFVRFIFLNTQNVKVMKAQTIKKSLALLGRVKSGKFGHRVNSDTHLQTV